MNQKNRKSCIQELKSPVVEMLETGKSAQQVAEELCISSILVYGYDRQNSVILAAINEHIKTTLNLRT